MYRDPRFVGTDGPEARANLPGPPVVGSMSVANSKTDEQLLAEHRAGIGGAFEELVRRYTVELYAFVARFVGSHAVDDIVQEAFVQVHLAANTFDTERKFKPWLYTIAANKARDFLRTRSRRQERSLDTQADEDDAGAVEPAARDEGSLLERSTADEDQQRVRRLIDEMPDHLRQILLLGYYQQLPYADISEILGIPLGTVKSRLHAAVQHFARAWMRCTEPQVDGTDGGRHG